MEKHEEIEPTPASVMLERGRALPDTPCGDYPRIYDQVIPGNAKEGDKGMPDPAHYE